ncbi:MAG: phosphatidylserine decarboxylase [Candidatus Cloacimonadota bacterium]|nr:phosphatidylserine decarboxylase [Candidatus Cloacimonadota bacterium]
MDTNFSKLLIPSFVENYAINLSLYENRKFNSFNDFFTRKLINNQFLKNEDKILSPAEGRILVYDKISMGQEFEIKSTFIDIYKLLKNAKLAKIYQNGSLAIIRLAPVDYHRYYFPVSGEIGASTQINGSLYSVSPIALNYKPSIFVENKREFSIIENSDLGRVLFCEVGATFVGSIVQSYEDGFIEQTAEKGFFKFGGSTIILIFEENKMKFDDDLIQNTKDGFETKINVGMQIGSKI